MDAPRALFLLHTRHYVPLPPAAKIVARINPMEVLSTLSLSASKLCLLRTRLALKPKAFHHKIFDGTSTKVHVAAFRAVSDNPVEARQVTALEAGQTNVTVMFDGNWQKRGHKSHNRVVTAISIDTGLCLDLDCRGTRQGSVARIPWSSV